MSRAQVETILVVSHLETERDRLAGALRKAGHGVRTASATDEAVESYQRDAAAVVVADGELPGPHLAGVLRAEFPDAVVVLVAREAGVEDVVAFMRDGAFHVLEKPVAAEQLTVVVAKALEHGRLSRGNRQLRSQLDISEKLAMIGRLASGVAHELNNPLDGVRRYVRMTKEGLADEGELTEYLDRAMSGLGRMASIVRQLLTFSRNVVLENEGENLRSMLQEVVRTLAPTGSAGPVVELENPYVDASVPRALFQVFVNLIKNALDSVESKGPRGRVKVVVSRDEDLVEVKVEDNGYGIEPGNLRRVFEPFFTTKEVGKGTGLGLPISARIVERCGGTIRIESEIGQGTKVYVALPVGAAVRSTTLQGASNNE